MTHFGDEPLGYLLYRVMAALRPQLALELGALGIGVPEFVCMRILSQNPGLTSAEMARGTNVTAQAMNQILHLLEDRGAVSRPTPTSAGNAMPAKLTRQGKALLTRANRVANLADQPILAALDTDQQRQLKHLLAAIAGQSADPYGPANTTPGP